MNEYFRIFVYVVVLFPFVVHLFFHFVSPFLLFPSLLNFLSPFLPFSPYFPFALSVSVSPTSVRVSYERLSFAPLAITWAFSALWHGLYPGYYLAFGTMIIGSLAARKVRRVFRHRFQSPPRVKLAYDIATWLGATMLRDFAGAALLLLLVEKSFQIWR